jgi:hypothetical protein
MRLMRPIALPAAIAALSVASSAGATPSAEAAGLRLLTWPGKTAAPTQPRRQSSAEAPRPAAPSPAPAPAPAPKSAALPTSIYAPPPPVAAPVRSPAPAQAPVLAQAQVQTQVQAQAQVQAQPQSGLRNDAASPRFYSLHRAYGDTPDPVALSPQFFATPTQDLADPPPPPPRTVTTSSGQVVRTTNSDPAVN